MSSLQFSNIFHTRKTSLDYSRTKRSTISFSKDLEDSDSYNYDDNKKNTLSKVKRFGSMLIRGKKSPRPDVHIITSPQVDTVGLPASNYSAASLTPSIGSEEEDLETPIEAVTPKDISNAELIARAASPDSMSTDIEENSTFLNNTLSADGNEHKLNLMFLVQCQLHNVFDQIDTEIEIEIEQSRKRMLKTINYVPPLYSL